MFKIKIYQVMIFIIINQIVFSATYWKGENQNKITVIYKILNPLVVEVDKPERLRVNRAEKEFKYSSKSEGKKRIKVTVEAPYNKGSIDDILRKIYERVYFRLDNDGRFELLHDTDSTAKIEGQGYFVDEEISTVGNRVTSFDKSFYNNVGGENFNATTEIDVDFKLPSEFIPLGVYRGILKLNVWFGGTIN